MKKKLFLVFMAILGIGIQPSNCSNQDFNNIPEAEKAQVDRLLADLEQKRELESFLAKMYEEVVEKPAPSISIQKSGWDRLNTNLNEQRDAIIGAGGNPRLRIPKSGIPYYENFITKNKNFLISQFDDLAEDEIHRLVAFSEEYLKALELGLVDK